MIRSETAPLPNELILSKRIIERSIMAGLVPRLSGLIFLKQSVPAHSAVMRGLVPRIHVLAEIPREKTWMAGTSPAMTTERVEAHESVSRKMNVQTRSPDERSDIRVSP